MQTSQRFGLALLTALATACASPLAPPADGGADTLNAESGFDAPAPTDAPLAPDAPGPDAPPDAPGIDVSETPDVTVTPDAPVVPGTDLSRAGPITPANLPRATFTLPGTTGCTGTQCTVQIDASYPSAPAAGRAAPYPLAILSNRFQLTDEQYLSYATRLASWGYVVLRWNTTGESLFSSIGHGTLGHMAAGLIDWAATENARAGSPLAGLVATDRALALGHSRGGKASVLAATFDPRIAGVFAIDPVNAMSDDAVAALRAATRAIPLAVVGSELGGMSSFGMPCAPPAGNYAVFYDAAMSPAFEAVVRQAGHMQFLDNPACGLTCTVCPAGSAMPANVRAFTQTLMVAWAERVMRGADTASYTSGAWIAGEVARGVATSRNR